VSPEVISVSQFVSILNETMQLAFPKVLIEGEVSSFKVWQNRYIYFDLKDDTTTLNCFMAVYSLKIPIEDGMRVRVEGSPKLTDKGRFSLTVRSVEPTGEGAIRRAYELLKAKLEAEGLFAAERKRPLPGYPERIGLVTAPQSAAYADFMKIVLARWPGLNIEVAPVQVQGKAATDQIVAAIAAFNQAPRPPDALVLIRGGGSLEDLQAFSAETVVRAIAASRIPTLLGVGHEVDTSLADLAADVRAATPTDAAQRLVYDRQEVLQQLVHRRSQLERAIDATLATQSMRLDRSATGLEAVVRERLAALGRIETSLWQSLKTVMATAQQRLEQQAQLLQAINPRAILGRGYSITRLGDRVLRGTEGVGLGAELVIELSQGTIDTSVTGVHNGKH
jgi:exodeoxyribonuclease VII large subunit